MQKTDILCLRKAIRNCIQNATLLLWGGDSIYPTQDDIAKARALVDTAFSIDARVKSLEGEGERPCTIKQF